MLFGLTIQNTDSCGASDATDKYDAPAGDRVTGSPVHTSLTWPLAQLNPVADSGMTTFATALGPRLKMTTAYAPLGSGFAHASVALFAP